jgi:hypothetical protein
MSRQRLWSRRRAILIVVVLLALVMLLGGGTLLASAMLADVHAAYVREIVEKGKQPAFMLTLAFLLTFGCVRLITYSIRYRKIRFLRNVTTRGGLHIHHMVPGMLLVLASGYLGLIWTDDRPTELLAILFGIGAALVLDEYALWLRLADVYWEPEGRESVDAVVMAGGIGVLYLLGFDFWPHLTLILTHLAWPFAGNVPPI